LATFGGIDPTLPLAPIEPEKRRRLQLVAAALLAVVLLVLGVVVAFNRGEDPNLVDASSANTTSTTVADPIVVPTSLLLPASTTSTAVPRTTSTTRRTPRTTTTTIAPPEEFPDTEAKLVCAQTTHAEPSDPPADWENYWQTKPKPNDALDLVICVDDDTPKVGATVKLYVLAQDKDAEIGSGSCDVYVSWDSNAGSLCRDTVVAPPAEPKPTPAEKPGKVTMTFIHEYAEPGEWIIDVNAWSPPENTPDRNPYASYNSIELRVNVHR
jgi:hypothetical protein